MAALTRQRLPGCWARLTADSGFGGRRCVRRATYGTEVPRQVRESAALVATELATNGVRHAQGAELFTRVDGEGVHLVVIDHGPGIRDLERSRRDGVSTAGGLGVGLGAVERLSSRVEWHADERGTVVHAVVGDAPARRWAVVERPHPREADRSGVTGDAWWIRERGDRVEVVVLDAWGHGPRAADAGERAMAALRARREADECRAEELLQIVSAPLTRERGVVAAALCWSDDGVDAALVGNVMVVLDEAVGGRQVLPTAPGALPGTAPRTFSGPSASGLRVLLATDGVSPRRLPSLRGVSSAWLAAGIAYRDAGRPSDDALVVVIRGSEG